MASTGFDVTSLIGFGAAILTTLAFLPQVIKVWHTHQTRDISLGMFLLFCLGITLWLIYGVLQNDLPLILANTVTLVLSGTILILKLKYK